MLNDIYNLVKSQEFKSFLVKAKKSTYAGDGKEVDSSRLKSHDLVYEDGDFIYRDSYFGKSSFSGQEIVYYKNTPIWSMVYYGSYLEDFNVKTLKDALSSISEDDELPVRGAEKPMDKFVDEVLSIGKNTHYQKYYNRPSGDLTDFEGEETIYDYIREDDGSVGDNPVFICTYTGGIIKE